MVTSANAETGVGPFAKWIRGEGKSHPTNIPWKKSQNLKGRNYNFGWWRKRVAKVWQHSTDLDRHQHYVCWGKSSVLLVKWINSKIWFASYKGEMFWENYETWNGIPPNRVTIPKQADHQGKDSSHHSFRAKLWKLRAFHSESNFWLLFIFGSKLIKWAEIQSMSWAWGEGWSNHTCCWTGIPNCCG